MCFYIGILFVSKITSSCQLLKLVPYIFIQLFSKSLNIMPKFDWNNLHYIIIMIQSQSKCHNTSHRIYIE